MTVQLNNALAIEKPIPEIVTTMKRYEYKYILTPEQAEAFIEKLKGRMVVDAYGRTTIKTIYYDTPDHRLIRSSIERPFFKEKLRLRAYGPINEDSTVFLELKRKVDGIVYKRRVATTQKDVDGFLNYSCDICEDGQIAREITYFRDYYEKLIPTFMIIYDRTAYFEPGGDLRLTIDADPRYRTENLKLHTGNDGVHLIPHGKGSAILEIKVQQAMPLWLSAALAELKIYKTSFSKVGEAYKAQAKKIIINNKEDQNV
ncbi:MAG: polyphosphate polymerase domain-containing protein [Clostridia bacterium]|nr:polyphosphate polymerase domain-containing protein [Clostridia bacterium]